MTSNVQAPFKAWRARYVKDTSAWDLKDGFLCRNDKEEFGDLVGKEGVLSIPEQWGSYLVFTPDDGTIPLTIKFKGFLGIPLTMQDRMCFGHKFIFDILGEVKQ
jgi:hypothetical protein